MKKKSNSEKQATNLMIAKRKIWKKLNIYSGNDVELNKTKHDSLLIKEIEKLGYNKDNKVSEKVRQILENENSHTMNRVLQENNLGEGNF